MSLYKRGSLFFDVDTGEEVKPNPFVPFYKTPHNYDVHAEGILHGEFNGEPSLTVQSMSEETDLNVILARQGIGGFAMPENPRVPSYGDFVEAKDFRSSLDAIKLAQEMFMEYPASVRGRFENDPQKFMDFCHALTVDGKDLLNREEMVRMGIVKEPPVVVESKPMKVEVVNPTAAVPPK